MTPLAILQHIIVWLPLVIGGIFLIRAGLRGRRINDHPICRRCRFDLVGLVAASAAETPDTALESGATKERAIGSESRSTQSHPDRCPECGTALTGNTRRARRAVIDGERRKRWRLFALGVVLLVSGLATGFWLSYKPLAKFPWTTWMPDWVLAEMVDSQNAGRAIDAMFELLQRIQLGTLDQQAATRAIDLALGVQANLSRPWNVGLGNMVEVARESGFVSDEQWIRYAKQAVVLRARVRPVVTEHSQIPWDLSVNYRVGNRAPLAEVRPGVVHVVRTFGVRVRDLVPRVGGVEPEARAGGSFTMWGISGDSDDSTMSGGIYGMTRPLGPCAVQLRWEIVVFDPSGLDPSSHDRGFDASDAVASMVITREFDITIVPDDTPLARLTTDDALASRLRAALSAENFRIGPGLRGDAALIGTIVVREPGIDGAFEAFAQLRHADNSIEELPMSGLHFHAQTNTRWQIQGTFDRVLDPHASLSIILRPSVAAAARTVDLTEIWGEEIVIENVPVDHRER